MKTIRLKTNLKCNNCIAIVKPSLDAVEGMIKWEVDLTNPDKELKAELESETDTDNVISAFRDCGYDAELIP